MKHTPARRTLLAATALVGASLLLAGCASSAPLSTPDSTASASVAGTVVVGSQQYYSNEIIAELYAQALEAKGFTVEREFQIGQREVYLPELEAGRIDLLPEYNGNLVQYYDKATQAKTTEEITMALAEVLPDGLRPLAPAEATDQDSYTVTRATANAYGLVTIADLAKLPQPVLVAGNSELAVRPYGPQGLSSVYGVTAQVVPVEDSGGPLTLKALLDGTVVAADIYTADPAIGVNDLVSLADPEALILPQNVVPIASDKVNADMAAVIDAVSAELDTAELIGLNAASVNEQAKSADLARDWLADKGLA